MTDDLTKTLDAMEIHSWRVVLLASRSKRPTGKEWHLTTEPATVQYHVNSGGNVGLVCGPSSRVAVLDFDQPAAFVEMCSQIGPLLTTVETGSGKYHVYVKWQDSLPARIHWQGSVVGEIQRGPALQHVVMPPSFHPDTGNPYRWAADPRLALPGLPQEWVAHLAGTSVPDYVRTTGDLGHPAEEAWDGPSPEELRTKALQQPGARPRRNGVKFQCPGCARAGRDRSRDNAILYLDGRWGCAVDPDHRRAIGEVLGVTSVTRAILGTDEDDYNVSVDDL
jgi:hypothetical protein